MWYDWECWKLYIFSRLYNISPLCTLLRIAEWLRRSSNIINFLLKNLQKKCLLCTKYRHSRHNYNLSQVLTSHNSLWTSCWFNNNIAVRTENWGPDWQQFQGYVRSIIFTINSALDHVHTPSIIITCRMLWMLICIYTINSKQVFNDKTWIIW